MIDEKLKKIIDFLKQYQINPPTEVMNAISDAINENDKIDDIEFYFKKEIDDFKTDMTLENRISVQLDGKSEGHVNDVFTYHGNINVSLSEFVSLYKGEELLKKDITEVDNKDKLTEIVEPDDYVVTLLETTEWENGEVKTTDILKIYCPEEVDDD